MHLEKYGVAVINKAKNIKVGLNQRMNDGTTQVAKKCDDCGAFHDKDELVRHFQGHYHVCRGCISDYNRMYKKN